MISTQAWLLSACILFLMALGGARPQKVPLSGLQPEKGKAKGKASDVSLHRGNVREMYEHALHKKHGAIERLQDVLELEPYVSVVLAMRNDDYGGNLLHRFERAIADLAEAALRHGLHYELVVIEWNPPPDRVRLREAVRWPAALLDVRIITVPEEVHRAAACRGWEYEAKNLGVSLARGKFVLTSNADIILSDSLVHFLASQVLRTDSFYRADRLDCIELIPRNYTATDAQAHCNAHAVRHLYSWGLEWFPLPSSPTPQVEGADKLQAYHRRRDAASAEGVAVEELSQLHHTGAGDFLLLSREHFVSLRGFPRASCCQSYCDNHTDSYMAVAAAAAGLRQVELRYPQVLFHQEHFR
jgi:hypothetical protein